VEVRAAKEAELKDLLAQVKQRAKNNMKKKDKEQKNQSRYKMVKFFERKKISRKMHQIEDQLQGMEQRVKEDENELLHQEMKNLEKQLSSLKTDLLYIKHYPLSKKYISVFSKEPKTLARKEKIKEKILAQFVDGLALQQNSTSPTSPTSQQGTKSKTTMENDDEDETTGGDDTKEEEVESQRNESEHFDEREKNRVEEKYNQ